MLDTLAIVFVSLAVALLAYRAATLNSAADAEAAPDAETSERTAKSRWAVGRSRSSWRTQRDIDAP